MTETIRNGFAIAAGRVEEVERHLDLDLAFDIDDPVLGPVAAAWATAHEHQMTAKTKSRHDFFADVKDHLRHAIQAYQVARRTPKEPQSHG